MRLVAVLTCAVLIMPATVFAQAGSTGGTIGKTDKSLSGSRDQPATEKESPKRKEDAETSLIGRWRWRASCSDGTKWEAIFVASGAETGNASIEYIGALGGAGTGNVSGNRVTLSRTFAYVNQTWTATLSNRNRMVGKITSTPGGHCSFEANR